MKITWKERHLQHETTVGIGSGRGTRGLLPTAPETMMEFASEPGFRPSFEKSGNPRVHKS